LNDNQKKVMAGMKSSTERLVQKPAPLVKPSSDDQSFDRKKKRILAIAFEEGLRVKDLVVHDNIHTLASVDSKKNLRLQEIFLSASEKVLRSLIRIIARKSRKDDNEIVNRFIAENPPYKGIKELPKSLTRDCIGPYGRYYDLKEILDEIMEKYTGEIDGILISWRKQTTGKSSVTWGSYRDLPNGGIIRVNSVLDKKFVPRYVVESIVYHELLHHLIPMEPDGTLQRVHTRSFNDLLEKFPDFDKAERWKLRYFNKITQN
jgi:hypothetical protein